MDQPIPIALDADELEAARQAELSRLHAELARPDEGYDEPYNAHAQFAGRQTRRAWVARRINELEGR